jgi:hypothetical protein
MEKKRKRESDTMWDWLQGESSQDEKQRCLHNFVDEIGTFENALSLSRRIKATEIFMNNHPKWRRYQEEALNFLNTRKTGWHTLSSWPAEFDTIITTEFKKCYLHNGPPGKDKPIQEAHIYEATKVIKRTIYTKAGGWFLFEANLDKRIQSGLQVVDRLFQSKKQIRSRDDVEDCIKLNFVVEIDNLLSFCIGSRPTRLFHANVMESVERITTSVSENPIYWLPPSLVSFKGHVKFLLFNLVEKEYDNKVHKVLLSKGLPLEICRVIRSYLPS